MQVDLIIQNALVYNSFTKSFLKDTVVIHKGKFLYIGTDVREFTAATYLDATGKYLVPGLIDIHMHIESTMATPGAFAHECARHGVTTLVAEPHEIANVFGLRGVQAMLENSKDTLVDIFFGVPSSVPSTNSELETTGGEISQAELQVLLQQPQVICLGEIMNYVDVIYKEHSKTLDFINYTREKYPYLAIEGHCPRIKGNEIGKMLYAGVMSDHTQQSAEGIVERFLQGMFVELQSKSLKPEIIEQVRQYKMYEQIALVTDDIMADEFVEKGQLDKNLRKIIQLGLTPEQAIYIASYTPARYLGMRDRGAIAAGRWADFFLTDDPRTLPVEACYKNGRRIYDAATEFVFVPEQEPFAAEFRSSVQRKPITAEDLTIKVTDEAQKALCNVLETVPDATFTKALQAELPVQNGVLAWENSPYALLVCLERYGRGTPPSFALVKGVCPNKGALATTYAHDHHNIMVIGKNIGDMVLAVNRVIELQGAYCAVLDGEFLACVHLPIGGILSPLPMHELALQIAGLKQAFVELGYLHKNPLMSLGTLSLPVSPELKLTDKGLIMVKTQAVVPLIVKLD